MARLRGFLSVTLAFIACLLVSCGGPTASAPPPTYSAEQLQQIQLYLPSVEEKYAQMENLAKAIQQSNWQQIRTIMRGPLGQMIQDMYNVDRHLLPADQKAAKDLTRKFFEDFVAIDQAATNKSATDISKYFDLAVRDYEQFLSYVPKSEDSTESET
jgi:photosystem II protein PsbQ